MKPELSKIFVNNRVGLCEFVEGPLGRMTVILDKIVNPYWPQLRPSQSDNWFFGNKINEKK